MQIFESHSCMHVAQIVNFMVKGYKKREMVCTISFKKTFMGCKK
jgi:hypothetical protein